MGGLRDEKLVLIILNEIGHLQHTTLGLLDSALHDGANI